MTAYREEAAYLVNDAVDRDIYTCLYKPVNPDAIITLIDGISRNINSGV